MGSTAPRRPWVMPVAMLAIMLLVGAIVVVIYSAGTGRFRHSYLAYELSPGHTVWFEFRGTQVRKAASPEGLEQAEWIPAKVAQWERTEFAPITLTAQELGSAKWDEVEAAFSLFGDSCVDRWRLTRRDDREAPWELVLTTVTESLGEDPRLIGPEPAPTMDSLQLALEPAATTAVSPLVITPYMRLTLGGPQVRHLHCGRKEVICCVQVVDVSGQEVALASGPIAAFSGYDGCHVSVPSRGTYTCVASVDTGPIQGVVKKQATVTVP